MANQGEDELGSGQLQVPIWSGAQAFTWTAPPYRDEDMSRAGRDAGARVSQARRAEHDPMRQVIVVCVRARACVRASV